MKSDMIAVSWKKEYVYDDTGYTNAEGQSFSTLT